MPRALFVERVVVADDSSADRADSARLQLFRPALEQARSGAVPVVDARIAGADDQQVAIEEPRSAAVPCPMRRVSYEKAQPSRSAAAARVTSFILDAGTNSLRALSV